MPETPSTRLPLWTAVALQVLAVLIFGLHLYVYLALPSSPPNTVPEAGSMETAWWGLWPVHYLSPWQVVLGGALLVGAIATTWLPGRKWESVNPTRWRFVLPAVTVALVAAFYLFPIAHTRWGDAFMLAKGIAFPDPSVRLTHSWQAPLDVFLHAQTWLVLHGPLGWKDAMPAYRLLSPLAGLIYLLVVLALSRQFARHHLAPPWLTYGMLATLGLLQLFFGYVENYSFAAAGILAFLWLGLGVVVDRRPLWLAATILAITNATHPSTVILAPSLIYLGWHLWRSGNKSLLRCVLEIALPMVLIGGATFVWMEASGHGIYALLNTDRPGGGDANWFVPLLQTTTRWEHYTMFSWGHLRDWLNEQILVAPIVLPGLVIVAVNLWLARGEAARGRAVAHVGVRTKREVEETSQVAGSAAGNGVRVGPNYEAGRVPGVVPFLVIAAGFYLLFTFVWNPDYGGQRDWDLFSLASLAPALLLIVLLPRALPTARFLRAGAAPLLVVQGWHTLAWIVQNTLPWEWPD
jgi:hypothetical protein